MHRIQRAVAALVFVGVVASTSTGCSSMGGACGSIFNLALGLGVAVGTYYLTQELTK
jgi:hypothetical protein